MITTSILFLIFSGIFLFAFVNHFIIGLQRPLDKVNLLFSIIVLSRSLFIALFAFRYMSGDLDTILFLETAAVNSLAVFWVSFVLFSSAFTRIKPNYFSYGIIGTSCLIFLYNSLSKYSISYINANGLVPHVSSFGDPILIVEGETNPLVFLCYAMSFCCVALACYQIHNSTHLLRRLKTVFYLALLIYLVTITNDLLVEMKLYSSIPLGSFGAMGFLILMSSNLNFSLKDLEKKVKEKTKDLEAKNAELEQVIASRLETEKKLSESEARYRAVIEDIPLMICRYLPDSTITFVNQAYCVWFNRTVDDLLGKSFLLLIPEENRESVFAAIQELTLSNPTMTHEHMVISTDNTERWHRWTNRALFDEKQNLIAYQAIGEDITKQKQLQEKLENSESRYRLVFNQQFQFMAILSPDGIVLDMSDLPLLMQNMEQGVILGIYLWESPAWRNMPHMKEKIENNVRIAKQSKEIYMTEDQFETSNGEIREALATYHGIFDGDELKYVLVQATDITDRKKAETDRERLILAVEQAAEMIVITDAEWNIIYSNPSFSNISGYSKTDSLNMNVDQLLAQDTNLETNQNAFKLIIPQQNSWNGRISFKKQNNTSILCEMNITKVQSELGDPIHFILSIRDIDEEIKLQEKLYQAQKMESVGRLAGGVAHDFNNMLLVILGYSNIALEELDQSHPAYANLQEVIHAAERSADLTKQLLAFARKQTAIPETLNVNRCINSMLKMLYRIIGETVQLHFQPQEDLWTIHSDPTQIDQIIANLCVNARDAIDGNGEITIKSQNCSVTEPINTVLTEIETGDYVLITVTDTGCGIKPEDLNNIFEPFFTTKKQGDGTGLGLATVYGIVRQNNGYIDVVSEQYKGSTFKIYIPRFDDEVIQKEKPESSHKQVLENKTALLVEDEPLVLNLAKTSLEKLGLKVYHTNNPIEAVEIFKDHADEIDLVMTDIIMPDMDGYELANTLNNLKHAIQVILISGYTNQIIKDNSEMKENFHFIQKPFSFQVLSERIHSILSD